MSGFYPPGVSSLPWDEEGPCDVCGKQCDECICPECPICLSPGDPYCYDHHGLVRTQEQTDSRAEYEKWHKEFWDGFDD